MSFVDAFLLVTGLYMAIGLLIGVAFIIKGVTTVDSTAHGAPWSFRLIILPGAAALWPAVLRWWLRARREGHS